MIDALQTEVPEMIAVDKLSDDQLKDLHTSYWIVITALNEAAAYASTEAMVDDDFIMQISEARSAAWQLWSVAIRQSIGSDSAEGRSARAKTLLKHAYSMKGINKKENG